MKRFFLSCLIFIVGFSAGYAFPRVPASAAVGYDGADQHTTLPVTPGNPESYVGTVGQCPFYERVDVKGCVPPSNLQCNADWSVCTPKDESTPISTPTTPPAASETPNSANCTDN